MDNQNYDSTADTLLHIKRVNELLIDASVNLLDRGKHHDSSKLEEPEKSAFDIATPKLKDLVFGTPEYQQSLDGLKPALDHHYANNSHHPQHYQNGIEGMDLFDLIEMIIDWKAAGERTSHGNIIDSITINAKRFGISEQLEKILRNTAFRYYDDDLPF